MNVLCSDTFVIIKIDKYDLAVIFESKFLDVSLLKDFHWYFDILLMDRTDNVMSHQL